MQRLGGGGKWKELGITSFLVDHSPDALAVPWVLVEGLVAVDNQLQRISVGWEKLLPLHNLAEFVGLDRGAGSYSSGRQLHREPAELDRVRC